MSTKTLNCPTTDALMTSPLRDGNDIPDLCRRLETVLRGILDNDGSGRIYNALALADFRDEAKRILEGQP